MVVDTPAAGTSAVQPLTVAGWAVDRGAPEGVGVDAVHVWAFPVGGGSPTFVGAAAVGLARPDLAAILGDRFTHSGFALTASGLSPGDYELRVFAHSTATGTFNQTRIVRLRVAR
jgi:hypothetical protein